MIFHYFLHSKNTVIIHLSLTSKMTIYCLEETHPLHLGDIHLRIL